MDHADLLRQFQRVAVLRGVSHARLGDILIGDSRAFARLTRKSMTFGKMEVLSERLAGLEAELSAQDCA